jgi:hypothetical protein
MTKIKKNDLLGISPNSEKIKNYKESLFSLSKFQYEASIGLMLGDASLNSQNDGKSYRLKFEWGQKNLSYVNHVYDLFDEWVLSKPHKKTRISPKGNSVITYGFQTISHNAFNFLSFIFLLNGRKGISRSLITDYLTPVGLAYWFMDDGGKLDYNPKSINKSLVLNTQCFLNKEVFMMTDELNKKFKLNCEVRSNKGKKVIVIKNYDEFIKLSGSYIIPEMVYKLPNFKKA